METAESLKEEHVVLPKGMFISRVDGDIITYDLRTRRSNEEEVMENATIHTFEHLFTFYVRGSKFSDDVIYFGPMGSRTGFCFLLRNNVGHRDAIALVKGALEFVSGFEGEIPGLDDKKCGNVKEHDIDGAKREAAVMSEILKEWKSADLYYPE